MNHSAKDEVWHSGKRLKTRQTKNVALTISLGKL
jgi:hypothetical protein